MVLVLIYLLFWLHFYNRQGKIFSITVENEGRGYTFAPEIKIVESDVEAFANSDSIGIPQSVTFIRNGGAFHLDKTVSSSFTSNYVAVLKNYSGDFRKGELVVQKVNNVEIPYVFDKRRKGDLARSVANNKLATSLLNWKPTRDIKDMCHDGWRWKKNNPYGYQ